MRRRSLLASLGVGGLASLPGCGGLFGDAEADPKVYGGGTPSPVWVPSDTPPSGEGDGAENGSGADDELAPGTLTVRNRSARERYVTVAVYAGDRVAFDASEVYAASGRETTRTFRNVVAGPGTYRVVVETDDGVRTEARWIVRGSLGGVAVAVQDRRVAVRQVARCDPGCPPVSGPPAAAGAESADSPDPFGTGTRSGAVDSSEPATESPSGGAAAGYALRLYNAGSGRPRVRVRLRHAGRRVLDRAYRPFPGLELRFPTYAPGRSFAVAVERGDDRWAARWAATSGLVLPLAVDGGGVRLDCDGGSATLGISSAGGQQLVRVRVVALDGRVVREERYGVSAADPVVVPAFVAEPGVYDVVVERENGATASERALVCGATEVRVRTSREGIHLRTVRRR